MGGESSSGGEYTMRYSPVVENAYQALIWQAFDDRNIGQTLAVDDPYIFPLNDFTGAFCDLYYNYYVPYVKDFDISAALTRLQEQIVDASVVDNQIAIHNQYLEDDINQNVLPKLRAGLRDIGAVMSSSFFDAQALVEANKQKAVSKFSADLKIRMFELSHDVWAKFLDWQWKVVNYQTNTIDLYYKVGSNYTKLWNDVNAGNILWCWTILDQVRAIVGALNGAQGARSGKETMTMSGIQTAAQYVGMAGSVASAAGAISEAVS